VKLAARLRRGQAMIEYTFVAHALLIGGAAMVWPFLVFLMRALSIYFQSIYFIITSPVP
jgi:hypothetical protein